MYGMRKTYLLATASIAALACGSGIATAADLGVRKAASRAATFRGPVPISASTAGSPSTNRLPSDLDLFLTFIPANSVVVRHTAALAGGHIGYNWQSRSLVYGIEADLSGVFQKDDDLTITGTGFEILRSNKSIRAGCDGFRLCASAPGSITRRPWPT